MFRQLAQQLGSLRILDVLLAIIRSLDVFNHVPFEFRGYLFVLSQHHLQCDEFLHHVVLLVFEGPDQVRDCRNVVG